MKISVRRIGRRKRSRWRIGLISLVLDDKGKPLYMERTRIDSKQMECKLNVKGVFAIAGIGPWNKMVVRDPGDNTIQVTM